MFTWPIAVARIKRNLMLTVTLKFDEGFSLEFDWQLMGFSPELDFEISSSL